VTSISAGEIANVVRFAFFATLLMVLGTYGALFFKEKALLSPGRRIVAGDAWTPTDSWLTNVSVIGGVFGGAWMTLGASPLALLPSDPVTRGAMGILFLIFAAAAGLAPIVYAAFGASSATNLPVTGTVFGYLLAAAATIFSFTGQLAALWVYVLAYANGAAPLQQAKTWLLVLLALAGAIVAFYVIRVMYSALSTDLVPVGEGGPKAPLRPGLVSDAPSPKRRSATL